MTQRQNTLKNTISKNLFGSATDASTQLKRTKEGKSIANGMSTPTTSVNQNVIGAKIVDIVRSMKFFNKKFTNIKEKNYETH